MKLLQLSLANLKKEIENYLIQSISVKEEILRENVFVIYKIAKKILDVLKNGKKIIIFGNGGSAADSQHIAAELVGKLKRKRKAYPAIALTTNTSTLTAISNDYSFKDVFKRQLEAFLNKGDLILAISTSGNSENVIKAVEFARRRKNFVIAFTGKNGGRLAKISNISLKVPSTKTSIIQEVHITIAHIICQLVEDRL
jgi:D-sedoheptulose 7-phosphate isomerase